MRFTHFVREIAYFDGAQYMSLSCICRNLRGNFAHLLRPLRPLRHVIPQKSKDISYPNVTTQPRNYITT